MTYIVNFALSSSEFCYISFKIDDGFYLQGFFTMKVFFLGAGLLAQGYLAHLSFIVIDVVVR